MKRLRCLAIVFVLVGSPACAQEDKQDPPSLTFAPFPLPLVRTYVFPANEVSLSKAFADPVFPRDFPPSLVLSFEDARKYNIRKGSYAFPSKNVLRVYRLVAMQKNRSYTIQKPLAELRKLLQTRPADVPENGPGYFPLPDYPERNAAHGFQLKLAYVDADWGSGVCYMTVFTQDGSNHASNNELQYIFQGVSKDGAYYVSADFHVSHPRLSTWRPPLTAKGDYTADRELLAGLTEKSFTPELPEIRRWLTTLKFD